VGRSPEQALKSPVITVVDVIVVDDLILNACLRRVCNSPDLMSVSQVRVMRSGDRVTSIIRIRGQTPMFCSCPKMMCRSSMVFCSGMVN
jgi:hypothetical protein